MTSQEVPIPPQPVPTPPPPQSKTQRSPGGTHNKYANGTPASFGRKRTNKNDIYKTNIDVCLFGMERRFYFSKTTPLKGWVEHEHDDHVEEEDEDEEEDTITFEKETDSPGTMSKITEDKPDDTGDPSRFVAKAGNPLKSRLGPSNMDNPSLLRDIRSLTSSRRLQNVPKTSHLASPDLDDGLSSRWSDMDRGSEGGTAVRGAGSGGRVGGGGGGDMTGGKRHVIDLQNLRRLSSQGIPHAGSHRGVAWRVLLGYIPTDLSKWEEVLERDRSLYRNLVSELFVSPGESPPVLDKSDADEETLKRLEDEEAYTADPDFPNKQALKIVTNWDTLKVGMEKRSQDDTPILEDQDNSQSKQTGPSSAIAAAAAANGESGAHLDSDDEQEHEDVSYGVGDICHSSHHYTKNNNSTKDKGNMDQTSAAYGSVDDEKPPNAPIMSTSRPNFNTPTHKPDALLPARIREHLKSTGTLGTSHVKSINELLVIDNSGNPTTLSPTPANQTRHQTPPPTSRVLANDDPLSEDDNSKWKQYFENTKLLDEIRKDVVRTHPDLHFFLEPEDDLGQRRYAALERILFVWAKLNKGVRYVQGMNEIVGSIYFVLATDFNEEWACEAEADCYFLFNTLMVEMRDVFVPDLDEADTGIQGRISNFVTLLSLHDPEVRCHLDDIGIDASFYAIRWLTTLLSREFLLPDTIRLWDSMFASTHKDNFLRYVCVTMVMIIRDTLLASDFSTCLRLLQAYPPTNIDRLLESSRALWIYESQITLACHKGGISLQMALNTITPPSGIIMAYGLLGGVAMDPARRLRAAGEKMVDEAKKVVKEDYESVKSASKSIFTSVGMRSWWYGK